MGVATTSLSPISSPTSQPDFLSGLPPGLWGQVASCGLVWKEAMAFLRTARKGRGELEKFRSAVLISPRFWDVDSVLQFLRSRSVASESKRRLDLTRIQCLSSEEMQRVTGLFPSLIEVKLPTARDDNAPFQVLTQNCRDLQILEFGNLDLNAESLMSICRCKALRDLSIRYGSLEHLTKGILQAIGENCPITSLHLEDDFEVEPAVFGGLSSFSQLEYLRIKGARLDESFAAIGRGCPVLTRLILEGCRMNSLSFLAQGGLYQRLLELHVSTDFDAHLSEVEMVLVSYCSNLTYLELRHVITSRTFQEITQRLQKLETLILTSGGQEEVWQAMAPSPNLRKVVHRHGKLTETGLSTIAQKAQRIVHLELDCRSLTPENLISILPSFQHLHTLTLNTELNLRLEQNFFPVANSIKGHLRHLGIKKSLISHEEFEGKIASLGIQLFPV